MDNKNPAPTTPKAISPTINSATSSLPQIGASLEDIPQPIPIISSTTPSFPSPNLPTPITQTTSASPTPTPQFPSNPQITTPPGNSGIIPPVSSGKNGKGKIFTIIAAVVLLLITMPVGLYLLNQRQTLIDQAAPSFTFRGGYYINLAGGGADANGNINAYNDEADCDPAAGICKAKNKNNGQDYSGGNVQKYICSGKVINCDNTNAPGKVIKGPDYSSIHYIYDTNYAPIQCDQTIQLDVFNGSNVLKGFMTWYSGACVGTPTPAATVTTCNNRTITQAVLEQELRTAGYGGPWDLASALAAFNRAACPTPIPTPVPTPLATPRPTPSSTPQGGTTVVASPSLTPSPKASVKPSPSPSPEAQLPAAGNSLPLIVASTAGIILLIIGFAFAL